MSDLFSPEPQSTNEPIEKLISRGFVVLHCLRVNEDEVHVLVGRGTTLYTLTCTANQLESIPGGSK